jgi:CheY-like chemotaxis protein
MRPSHQSARHRILVVDDADDLRDLLGEVLEAEGYEVTLAHAPAEAFEAARKHRVELVITDIMMCGGPTGLDLITRLRSDLAPPVPSIIACSGFPELGSEASRRGAVFLPKPFAMEDLLKLVDHALRGTLPPSLVSSAVANSEKVRQETNSAADEFLLSLGPRRGELRSRAHIAVTWVARFLGARLVAIATLSGGELCVEASSDEARLPSGAPVADQIPFLRDVFESRSTMILSGTAAQAAGRIDGQPVDFFAAVPVFGGDDNVSVGALCVLDKRGPTSIAEEVELLELLGRRATSALSELAGDRVSIPFFESEGVLEAGAFSRVLGLSMRRARAAAGSLEVGVVRLTNVEARADAAAELGGRERQAVTVLGMRRLAFFIAADADEAEARLTQSLAMLKSRVKVAGVGVVGIRLGLVPPVSEHEVLRLATLLERRARLDGGIARIVIKDEPLDAPATSAS